MTPEIATELLERDGELSDLAGALDDVRAGTGRLVAIEAQAGLGKSCLLSAARVAAGEAGLRVLGARGTELERDFPFALVRQLFEPQLLALTGSERDALFEGANAARTAFGSSGADGAAPQDGFAVLHGLYWLTAALADRGPLLLAIDDAHWSDAASLDYLSFLVPRLDELPVLLVVACRPDGADRAGRLTRVMTDSSARRWLPRALSVDAAAALLAAELGVKPDSEFATVCHEVSGGNPFLLCELARTLATRAVRPSADQAPLVRELMPERVGRTVLARLARLSPEAGAVARALAVLGDESDDRLVAGLADLAPTASAAAADELRAAAILTATPPLCFIHPLVRNAVYSDLPVGARASAHGRAAELLRERGASLERIAAQLVASEARGDRTTVETLLAAGRLALARGAPRSAIAYLTRALREPPPHDLRSAVLDPLLTASIRATDHETFTAIESELFAELDRTPGLRARWATRLTVWLGLSGRLDEAAALLEQAIDESVDAGDFDRAFQLEAQLSTVARLPPETARARLDRYRDRIEPDSPSGRLAAALESYWCGGTGGAVEAAELANRALLDGRIFAEQAEIVAPGRAIQVLLLANDFDGAQRGAEHALAVARRRGATPELASALFLTGTVRWARGDLAGAETDARQAIELARLGGLYPAVPLFMGLLLDILIERGELDAAERELTELGMAELSPAMVVLQPVLFERGRLHLAQGRHELAALDFLELQRRREHAGVEAIPLMQAGPYAARALLALGDRERALELAETDLAHARRWGAPAAVARALRAVGLAVGGTEGLTLLEEAATLLEESPARLLHAHGLADLGAARRRANQRAAARAPLRKALEIARRCGATALAKHVHDELQATGEKARSYVPIGVEALTPSERRVAELAASGMTNRQIAQTLFLTVKTIETHLSAAYDKLGIRTRRALPGALSGGAADQQPASA